MLKRFHLGKIVSVGSMNSHIPVKLIITLPCLSLGSPYVANQENIGQKNPISLQAPLFFWEELRPGIKMPLIEENSME